MKNKEGNWRRSRLDLFFGSMLAPIKKKQRYPWCLYINTEIHWCDVKKNQDHSLQCIDIVSLSVLSPPSPFVPWSKLESKWSNSLRRKRKIPYEKPVTTENKHLFPLLKRFCLHLICQVHEEELVGKPAVRVFKVKDKPLKLFWHASCQINWTIWN